MKPHAAYTPGASVYTERPVDHEAVYLTPDLFQVAGDGIADDSEAIQTAIQQVKRANNYGIVFIPEGVYRISKTIYIPKAIRLIGYGAKRPVILLGANTPGYREADPEDKGQASYMLWFTATLPVPGDPVEDANPGTFYSAMSNIDVRIEEGNPAAVALRTHFAQHSFVSHADLHIGSGKAGIFDVGNEIENVRFFGGDYGIYTTKTSPGWPFMMVDTHFEGQRKAAIQSKEAGLTIVRMTAKQVPTVIDTVAGSFEKLYMEDCRLDGVSGPAVRISNENNAFTQISLSQVVCRDVPVLASYRESGREISGDGKTYRVDVFTHGLQMELGGSAHTTTTVQLESIEQYDETYTKDIPDLPNMQEWANLKNLGAIGDGVEDDTLAIRRAIEQHQTIYVPQGIYRVTDTITMKQDTVLIGFNPISTQFVIADNTESFGGLGAPKPLLEAPRGGTNIVTGIGLDAGARNTRAVGCKWMAGSNSYMNDVKFMGGHGTMSKDKDFVPLYNPSRAGDINPEVRWDSQYWSLWVTDGGGGVFKDIWTASPYASSGFYASDTSTRGRIYAMSVEHHVRNEVRFHRVSNWTVLALQLEEELAESTHCLPLELQRCRDMRFANLYFFRTIWLDTPYPHAIKTWDCESVEFLNVHNYAQVKYAMDNLVYDVGTDIEVRPWQLNRLYIAGGTDPAQASSRAKSGGVHKLARGFEFADAITKDSKGNIYFVDSRMKRIYKWDVESSRLSLVVDVHYRPRSIAFDTEDRLLIVAEYQPSIGAMIDGKPEVYEKPADARGTSYGDWYHVGSTIMVYCIDPDQPEDSMQVLEKVPMDSIGQVAKALYPSNRWRDSGDFVAATTRKPKECYVALDGVTIIPVTYDLMRACSLQEAIPGRPFFGADEYYKRTMRYEVTSQGYLTNPELFAEKGEYNIAITESGQVVIPDGDIYIYDPRGTLVAKLNVPERPACVLFGGQDHRTLFFTARSSLYTYRPC